MYKLLKLLSHLLQSEYERQLEAEKDRTFWFCQLEAEYKLHKQTRDEKKSLEDERDALKMKAELLEKERDKYKKKAETNRMLALSYREQYNDLYNSIHPNGL